MRLSCQENEVLILRRCHLNFVEIVDYVFNHSILGISELSLAPG